MDKKHWILLIILSLTISVYAQLEIKEGSFKEVPGFVNINVDKMYDDNDKPYAVLKIKTENISSKERRELNFGGDAQTFFEAEYRDGEVWLYISYYASFIKISHEEYSSTEYYFPFDMQPKHGYELTLVNKSSDNSGWGSLTIITKPKNGANIVLNGRDLNQKTPYTNDMIPVGKYEITLSMVGYKTITKLVDIGDGDNMVFKIEMTSDIDKTNDEGAIDGVFSVSPQKRVKFSKGNLQYQASTNTWRFAEHQWDFIGSEEVYHGKPGGTVSGSDNRYISSIYNGWIDLFGWGTSGYKGKMPYMTSSVTTDYGHEDKSISNTNYDWGIYNDISNGSDKAWRTLTIDEWKYVLNMRNTQSGIRYAKAKVNGVKGLVLFPDNWIYEIYNIHNASISTATFDSNIISKKDWKNLFEANGAVFLPVAGYRYENLIDCVDEEATYWSSTCDNNEDAYHCGFNNSAISSMKYSRNLGHSVRLVCDVE